MSANFSSDSIVWVDGQVTLPKHILKILGRRIFKNDLSTR